MVAEGHLLPEHVRRRYQELEARPAAEYQRPSQQRRGIDLSGARPGKTQPDSSSEPGALPWFLVAGVVLVMGVVITLALLNSPVSGDEITPEAPNENIPVIEAAATPEAAGDMEMEPITYDEQLQEMLDDDIEQVDAFIQLAGANALVGVGNNETTLYEARYTLADNIPAPGVGYEERGTDAFMVIEQGIPADYVYDPEALSLYDIQLTDQLPIALQIAVRDGQYDLDLSALQLTSLQLEVTGGTVNLRLPERGGYTVSVRLQDSDLLLTLPSGPALRFDYDGTLERLNIDATRLLLVEGSRWETADYETASEQAQIAVLAFSGHVQIVE